ncbi:polyglutamine-binding protein 1-like [Mizuhopecten yessoensis]|uniref:Polyglutamine-binding protein 1 n=1 Tax=Mizuhopecten yessoensis TaxID=6573 RepID=A0A210PH22_MIZYE|nr:polyglutamine-binding protein 1-like [Mizuhopecten yessoensis]OWF35793.1 Polyglutamine-binding protein 1 [Mizuhopecten yessoensis]
MPLPAALLARLQKRGIVKEKEEKPVTLTPVPVSSSEPVEEVFAEDYDDPTKDQNSNLEEEESPAIIPEPENVGPLFWEVSACPNKNNPYHKCVAYCHERWGMETFNGSEDMLRKRDRMLRRHPLPEGWEEVADSESNRYYYWNVLTDEVSWLSPSHPLANVTVSAQRVKNISMDISAHLDGFDSEEDMETKSESDLSPSSSDSESEEEEMVVEEKRPRGGQGHGQRGRGRGRGGRREKDELDPMDPASYSEVPRGTWSTGLDRRGEAKTGADITASGPLFQQRPYPSPGEILRRNQGMPKE